MERAHKEIVELMPWYVNGTLTGPERASVEKHVKECLPCRAALREEQRLRGLVSAQDDVPVGVGHGVSDLMRKLDGSGTPTPRWLRPQPGLGVAAVFVAVVGWLVLAIPGPDAPEAGPSSAPFTTLTDGAAAARNRIDIVFAEVVTGSEVRSLIESFGARLIGGPSDLGRYTIAFDAASDDELAALIDRLAQDPRIRFVGRSYSSPPSGPGNR